MDDFVKVHSYSTAQELLTALMPWSDVLEDKGYVFRGHEDSSYKLVPQVLRDNAMSTMQGLSNTFARANGPLASASIFSAWYEYQLIRDFYKIADSSGLYVPNSARLREKIHHDVDLHTMGLWVDGDGWIPDDMLEATGLAQHYGVPTRLLDWSYDPLVAAYFASSSCQVGEGDLCVWALCQREVALLEVGDNEWPLSFSQPHYEGNPNLAAQKGLFTHWRSMLDNISSLVGKERNNSFQVLDRRSLEEQVFEYCMGRHKGAPGNLFKKLTLPRSETLALARLLRKLNYGPARIFPGYAGVALEMKERHMLRKNKDLAG